MRTDSEDKFLALLSDSKPVEEEPGKWRVYEFHEAFPWQWECSACRNGGHPAGGDRTEPCPSGVSCDSLGSSSADGQGEWTLCSFQPESPSIAVGSGLADIPFPEGCRRGLSLQAAGGAGLIAFSGPDQPEQWKHFYDDWFRRQGWQAVTDWQPVGSRVVCKVCGERWRRRG